MLLTGMRFKIMFLCDLVEAVMFFFKRFLFEVLYTISCFEFSVPSEHFSFSKSTFKSFFVKFLRTQYGIFENLIRSPDRWIQN